MNKITDQRTAEEKVYWYELALQAIASMKVDESQNPAHLAALVIAIAQTALTTNTGSVR